MKCDELTPIELECNMGKDINGVVHREPWKAYDIDEVDAAIAELKSENKMLKEHIANGDVSRITWIDEATELKAENEKLKAICKVHVEAITSMEADYKEACDRLQTANLIKDEKLAATRHQKYKRCLAMANYWGLVSVLVRGEAQLKCMRRELKWHKLAEKFKEAK